jgi:hypothetical protein
MVQAVPVANNIALVPSFHAVHAGLPNDAQGDSNLCLQVIYLKPSDKFITLMLSGRQGCGGLPGGVRLSSVVQLSEPDIEEHNQ